MLKPRIAIPLVLAASAVAAAGVAAATRHAQTTQAAAADFSAGSVSRSHTDLHRQRRHLPVDDRDLYRDRDVKRCHVERHARDPRIERREHDDEARLARGNSAHSRHERRRERDDPCGDRERRSCRLTGRSGQQAGSEAHRLPLVPRSRRRRGFAGGKLGSGSTNGAGVLYTRGDCRKPKQQPSTAVFHLHLTPGQVVPQAPA